jgi:hypothetical protein
MTDPLLELLERLPSGQLDASRAHRIRTRCHAALVHERRRARARAISRPRPAVRHWPLIAMALGGMYLTELARQVLSMYDLL